MDPLKITKKKPREIIGVGENLSGYVRWLKLMFLIVVVIII